MITSKIKMLDLHSQYLQMKEEIDLAIEEVLTSTAFINGPQVKIFSDNLSKYLKVKHVIPCANGTDALQIAMMALELKPGDEVIVPAFTYVATAEVIALLKLTPILVDVDPNTFCITLEEIKKAVSSRTKAVVPVHLFGQCCDMEDIVAYCKKNNIYVIEDNAQAIGAEIMMKNGLPIKAGTIGNIGTTSFFPTKNLGCYGDGGALFTNDDDLAEKCKMIANHGQAKKYFHEIVGCNSRLDTIQAAILDVKLKYLNNYAEARQEVALKYDKAFERIDGIKIPFRSIYSTHVFHQYTVIVNKDKRDSLQQHLKDQGIDSMIYYPLPLHEQKAYHKYLNNQIDLQVTERLCKEVLSLPIHTEMTDPDINHVINSVLSFFTKQ